MQRIHEQLQIESREANIQRSQHLTEIKENRVLRSQQMLALAETKELRIQKIVKEEGMSKASIVASQMQSIDSTSFVADRTRVRLRNQVFSYDYTRSQSKACRTRCQGTAVWLFDRAEFREWNEETLPICLWCSGISG